MALYDRLIAYGQSDWLPMHMPGHKRRKELGGWLPYEADITEIDGFDNLHHREGILKELADRMSSLRHSGTSIPLVNGSTVGILAAVYAMTEHGDTVLMARGCHKAVYHAAELRALKTVYVTAPFGSDGFFTSVEPEKVEEALRRHPQIKLVILTSPTYEGVVSDIARISDIVHAHGARLLVDGAHGAHLGYMSGGLQHTIAGKDYCGFPEDALCCGADVVVESLHKTLPAMTQTAVLHLAKGLQPDLFEHALDIFETSSPSYVLMASVERCVSLLEQKREVLFAEYRQALMEFDKAVKGLTCLYVPGHSGPVAEGIFAYDPGKIVVCTKRTGESAPQVVVKLRERYHIEPEMVCPDYFLCMTSIADTPETLQRLAEALLALDAEYAGKREKLRLLQNTEVCDADPVKSGLDRKTGLTETVMDYDSRMTIAEAIRINREGGRDIQYLEERKALGRISLEYVWAYPPGIPILAPGEVVTWGGLCEMQYRRAAGIRLQVGGRADDGRLKVL